MVGSDDSKAHERQPRSGRQPSKLSRNRQAWSCPTNLPSVASSSVQQQHVCFIDLAAFPHRSRAGRDVTEHIYSCAMEADWAEAGRLVNPAATSSTPAAQVTAFCFDPSEELLWTGSDTVSIIARRHGLRCLTMGSSDHDHLACYHTASLFFPSPDS